MGIDKLDKTVHIKMVTEPSINIKPGVMDIDHELSCSIFEYITNGYLLTLAP